MTSLGIEVISMIPLITVVILYHLVELDSNSDDSFLSILLPLTHRSRAKFSLYTNTVPKNDIFHSTPPSRTSHNRK